MVTFLKHLLGIKPQFNNYYDSYDGFSAKRYLHYSRRNKGLIISNPLFVNILPIFNLKKYVLENGFWELYYEGDYGYYYNGKFILQIYVESEKNEEDVEEELPKTNRKKILDEDKISEILRYVYFYKNESIEYYKFINSIEQYFKPKTDKKRYINFLTRNNTGFTTTSVLLETIVDIDFNMNYNDDFDHDKVQKCIDDEKNGLILLGGLAGSGKSYYIKYLIHNINRDFIYIPNEYINLMTSPEFINFALGNLKNYVVILEDCENVLISRDLVKTSAVPTILNLTDGIIGDILNLTVIGTYNTSDKIDTALFRKGRLLYEYHFDKLKIEKSNALSKKLGYNKTYQEEVALADVYNIEDNRIVSDIKKIGYSFTK